VRNVQLKTQADMNHQDYVANYALYQAAVHFASNLLVFWIEQGRNHEFGGKHLLAMMLLFLSMLYFTTFFVSQAFAMNDDLTPKQLNEPMDWRFRNILISYILYYLIVV